MLKYGEILHFYNISWTSLGKPEHLGSSFSGATLSWSRVKAALAPICWGPMATSNRYAAAVSSPALAAGLLVQKKRMYR